MSATQWIALGLFVFTYSLIVTERMHRLKAALTGLSGVLLLRLVEQHDAFSFIDFNTIGLLIGMMVLGALTPVANSIVQKWGKTK